MSSPTAVDSQTTRLRFAPTPPHVCHRLAGLLAPPYPHAFYAFHGALDGLVPMTFPPRFADRVDIVGGCGWAHAFGRPRYHPSPPLPRHVGGTAGAAYTTYRVTRRLNTAVRYCHHHTVTGCPALRIPTGLDAFNRTSSKLTAHYPAAVTAADMRCRYLRHWWNISHRCVPYSQLPLFLPEPVN